MAGVWNFVTDFGDSAVTVPLALLIAVFLGAAGQRRLALGWLAAIGGCALAIAALKLVFGACGERLPIVHIVSPSGHTAMSAVVYGSLAVLVGARLPVHRRPAVYAGAGIAIAVIALSRVALHDHTRAEIAVGLLVGIAATAAFYALLRRHAAPALPFAWLLLCGGVLVIIMHGTRWMIEPSLHRLAWQVRLELPWCR